MRLARLLAPLLVALPVAACEDDDPVRPPADATITLRSDLAADLGEKIVFLLGRMPGFQAIDAFGDYGSLLLSLTGARVSNVTVNTNLTGAAGAQSYQAVAVSIAYQNAPPGTAPALRGIVAFRASGAGQPYTDFAYGFAPAGVGAIPGSGVGGLAVVSGSKADDYATTQYWEANDGDVSVGQGAGTDPCPNSGLLALAAPGVTCATQFFTGRFTIGSAAPIPPGPGTRQSVLPSSRIIGVALTIDCEVSTLC